MADLICTVAESLTLNGAQQGGTNTSLISGINHAFKRIITVAGGANCVRFLGNFFD